MASISDYVTSWFYSNNITTTNLTKITVVSKEDFSSKDNGDYGFEIIDAPGPDNDDWIDLA